jgi:RNA recognition motif-containing protein
MSVQRQTLYLRNLDDKMRPAETKRSLFLLFSEFGRVVDIAVPRGEKKNGQAFVSFDSIESSGNALRALEGRMLFGKPIAVQYARVASTVIDPSARTNAKKSAASRMKQ